MNNQQAIKTLAKGKIILHSDDDGVIIEKTDVSKIQSSQFQKLLWIFQNIFWGILFMIAGFLILYFFIDKTSLSCYKESASAKTICQAQKTYSFRKNKKEEVLASKAITTVLLDESDDTCRVVLIDEKDSRYPLTFHYSSSQCG